MKILKTLATLLSLIYLSTIFHEAGHLLAALFLNFPVKEIALGGWPPTLFSTTWGLTNIKFNLLIFPVSGYVITNGGHLLVMINGPLANFVMALVSLWFASLLRKNVRGKDYLVDLYFANLGMGIYNLLPLPGIDGDQILQFYGVGWELFMLGIGLLLVFLTLILRKVLELETT